MKNIIVKIGAILLSIPLLMGCNQSKVENDFDKMREDYKNFIITSNQATIDKYKNKNSDQLKEEFKLKEKIIGTYSTYYIDGLDYDNGSDRNSWPAGNHVSVALQLAYIGEATNNNAIKELARKMTYYWVFNHYRSTNWWHNHLGAGGNTLSNLGLFVYDDLTDQGKTAMIGKISDASLYYHPSLLTHVGANLFDYADITLKESIISRNDDEFKVAFDRIEDEITDKNLEGFQTDGSFFQHGQQVQIASSYGKSVKRLWNVLRTLSKSSRVFNAKKLNIIDRYLLRGLRSMTHKGYLNYSAMSREIVRRNNMSASANGFEEFGRYATLPSYPNKEKLTNYIKSIENKTSAFDGVVFFDKAKMIVANIDDVYISFKGSAPNLTNTECVNDENELGINLSYGTNTCVMDDGDDYLNISPLWDYAYIPGTTSYNISDNADYLPEAIDDKIVGKIDASGKKTPNIRDSYNDQLYEQKLPIPETNNDYVYNDKYDENNNIAVMMQRSRHHKENYFTVTCITCDDGMVLLGADLKYDGTVTGPSGTAKVFDTPRKLHTTIDQSRKVGTLSNNNKTYTRGKVVYKSLDDNYFTQRKKIVADTVNNQKTNAEHNKYSWKRNSPQTPIDTTNRDNYLTWFEAGGNIDTVYIDYQTADNLKYAYSIQSNIKASEGKNFVVINNFNNNKVQEVKLPNGKVVIVAYSDTQNYMPSKGASPINLKKGEIKIIN